MSSDKTEDVVMKDQTGESKTPSEECASSDVATPVKPPTDSAKADESEKTLSVREQCDILIKVKSFQIYWRATD